MSIDVLPDEILIDIFLYLRETDILSCRFVCRKWIQVATDTSLIYYFRQRNIPLTERIVLACEQNNIFSFTIGVTVYCAFDINTIKRPSGTHDLWVKCMIAAAKGGSIQILRRVLSYGPTYGFKEAIEMAVKYNHLECAKLIHSEDNTNTKIDN